MIIEIFLIFAFGAIVGSFLNVLLLRKNTGESIVAGGSRCFSCGKKLGVWGLIPILSFAMLRGRCRYCGSKISWQYPIVEILTGLTAYAVFFKLSISNYQFPNNFQFPIFNFQTPDWLFIYYFAAFSSLFLVAAYDFKTKIIDSHFLYAFGAFAVLEFLMRGWGDMRLLAGDLASSFFIALFFYLMWRLSLGRWMGRGDADLAFLTSLFLGSYANLAALFLAFWIGGIIGAILLIFAKSYSFKSEIPFGPFLALGAFLAWYFSDVLGWFGVLWG